MTQQPVDYEQQPSNYWTRTHAEAVVLDIGEDVGALVLYAPPELHGREIEVSPVGKNTQRVHAAVLKRSVAGRSIFAAVYPALRAGRYRIWGEVPSRVAEATIVAGMVEETDWR